MTFRSPFAAASRVQWLRLSLVAAWLFAPVEGLFGADPPVRIPDWPTQWHVPPDVPRESIKAELLQPQGTMRTVELPDTLDLAELCGLSVNVLTGNMDPHWQAFNFDVDPPRGESRGAVLAKHIRTVPLLRAASGSTQGLDLEATQMQNQLEALTNWI